MKISLKDLVNLGLLDEEFAKDICNLFGKSTEESIVHITEEMMQDTFLINRELGLTRTPEPTEQEIAEWQEEYAKFKDLDFKTLWGNVDRNADREKPYSDEI